MSYFKKLFRNNLIVCLGYTMIFAILTYTFTLQIIRTEFNATSKTVLSQTAGYFNNCISKSSDLLVILKNSGDVQKYAMETEPDYLNRARVQSFLSSIPLPDREALVCLTHENDSTLICSNATMNASYFSRISGISETHLEQLKQEAKNTGESAVKSFISNSDSGSVLSLISCTHMFRNSLYTIVILPISKILGLSSPDMQFVITADQELLFSSDATSSKTVDALLNHEKLRGQNVFHTSSRTAGFLGLLHFYYIIPQNSYHASLVGWFLLLFAVLAVCLVLGLFLMHLITKKSYAPVEALINAIDSDHLPQDQSEFDYIQNKLTTLAQSNSELTQMLNEYEPSLEKSILKDMLYGLLPESKIQLQLERYGNNIADNQFITVLMEYSEPPADTEHLFLQKQTIDTLFTNHFTGYVFFRVLDLDTRRYAVIATIDNYEAFKRNLHRFLLWFSDSTRINLIAALGNPVKGMRNLHQSFSGALQLLENRIYNMQASTLFSTEDLENLPQNSVYYPPETESSIIEAVVNGNIDTLKKTVDSLFTKNFFRNPYSEEQYTQFIFMFASTFNRIFSALNKRQSDFFPENFILYLELKSCRKPQELMDKINEMLVEIIQKVSSQHSGQEIRNQELMKKFIDENYTHDIALLDLAEYMNFSIEHTSRLFKQLVGQNFKDYLSLYRYHKAKKMMDETPSIKIKDVALAVGCNSSAALSRIFLKYSGLSAGDYLRQLSK